MFMPNNSVILLSYLYSDSDLTRKSLLEGKIDALYCELFNIALDSRYSTQIQTKTFYFCQNVDPTLEKNNGKFIFETF